MVFVSLDASMFLRLIGFGTLHFEEMVAINVHWKLSGMPRLRAWGRRRAGQGRDVRPPLALSGAPCLRGTAWRLADPPIPASSCGEVRDTVPCCRCREFCPDRHAPTGVRSSLPHIPC